MRTHYYSAARAAMTGGDGMFSIGPPPTRAGWNHPLMAQMADALGLTFEMIQAHWTAMLLGYDPQKLLPPPTFTCEMCGGTFEKGWSDEEALAEKDSMFPGVGIADCAMICEDCFQRTVAPQSVTEWADLYRHIVNVAIEITPKFESMFRRIYGEEVVIVEVDDQPIDRPPLDLNVRFFPISELQSKPAKVHVIDEIDDMRTPPDDYLRHDPTKNTRRRRKWLIHGDL